MADDLRAQKTKAAIKDGFIDLLLEKRFMNISVKDITQTAKIGRGTFYLHYQDKYDLLNAIMNEATAAITQRFRPAYLFQNARLVPEHVREIILSIYSYFQNNERFYRALLFNEGIPSFRDRLQQQMLGKFHREVPTSLKIEKRVDPLALEILPQFVSSGMLGLIGWWFETGLRVPKEVIADNVIKMLAQISYL